ncbi:MAG: helicase C-terminal domain-containing protein [Cyanobacteria bacterium P01_A01_bin.135]
MARLVARAFRLQRSALIQAGPPSGLYGCHRLSYLLPAMVWPEPVIVVAPQKLQQRLLAVEIPRLKQWMVASKPIHKGDRWPSPRFDGILIMTPEAWLTDRLTRQQLPNGILTLVDAADDLETHIRDSLSCRLTADHWQALMLARPEQSSLVRETLVQLTHKLFQHPPNPYGCYPLDQPEKQALLTLYQALQTSPRAIADASSPTDSCGADVASFSKAMGDTLEDCPVWQLLFTHLQQTNHLAWATLSRRQGQFTLHSAPIDVAPRMQLVWQQQPFVLVGGALDQQSEATIYRERLGLPDLTCVKFAPDRRHESVQLYLPDRLPMPNTPQFQTAMLAEIRSILALTPTGNGLIVLLVNDVPLKAQVGAALAAEYGSRVQVERTCPDETGILVTGWRYWREQQAVLPLPQLLVVTTLPIPSLEHPLVAARVAYYKSRRLNWFTHYLLPETLNELQRAIAPLRQEQGIVALLDSRVNHRSYGHHILTALSPYNRLGYLDGTSFAEPNVSY